MNEEQFDRFYATSFSPLVGQIYVMCGSMAEAQDCVQEAFIRAWDHRAKLAPTNSHGWVRTVAYRLAVSRWRKAVRAFRQPDRALEPVKDLEPDPTNLAIASALEQLPMQQRRAIVLHHLADLTVNQVAAEMGAPSGTVKSWLVRGRETLARLLSDLEAHHA